LEVRLGDGGELIGVVGSGWGDHDVSLATTSRSKSIIPPQAPSRASAEIRRLATFGTASQGVGACSQDAFVAERGDQETTFRIALLPMQTSFGRACAETLLGAPWWLGLLRLECRDDAIVATWLHLAQTGIAEGRVRDHRSDATISAQTFAVAVDCSRPITDRPGGVLDCDASSAR
jgi:hypothetical protein